MVWPSQPKLLRRKSKIIRFPRRQPRIAPDPPPGRVRCPLPRSGRDPFRVIDRFKTAPRRLRSFGPETVRPTVSQKLFKPKSATERLRHQSSTNTADNALVRTSAPAPDLRPWPETTGLNGSDTPCPHRPPRTTIRDRLQRRRCFPFPRDISVHSLAPHQGHRA